MAVTSNDFATIPDGMTITEDAARFVETLAYDDIPADAIRIGLRCMLDAAGLYVAGSEEHSVHMLVDDARETGGRGDALLLGGGGLRVPVAMAARVLGTAGHAHDWDDTQVSIDPAHVYGLLTHPTIPPLTAALCVGQMLGGVDGRALMTAFQAGVEVESKISEWMLPKHYLGGKHSSGTVGTFGAYAAAAKLLGLTGPALRQGFGIAASLAAGIRCNFGTMTKPLHVGRACGPGGSGRAVGVLRRAWRWDFRRQDCPRLRADLVDHHPRRQHQTLPLWYPDPSHNGPDAAPCA